MVRSVEPSVSHKRLEGFLSLSFSLMPLPPYFLSDSKGIARTLPRTAFCPHRGRGCVVIENRGALSLRIKVRCRGGQNTHFPKACACYAKVLSQMWCDSRQRGVRPVAGSCLALSAFGGRGTDLCPNRGSWW